MKTIFITSFHPHISRNILQTTAFERLKKNPNLRIVLVVPEHKEKYFAENYGGTNSVVRGIPLYGASKTKRGLFFKKLAIFLFNTKSALNRKQYDFYLNKKYSNYCASLIFGFLGRFGTLRAIVRMLDMTFSPKGFFVPLLAEFKPDLIFSTDVQNENDVSLMQDARRQGIRIAAMVRSWDNLTLRFLRVFPDTLVVGSQKTRDEAIRYHGFPRERIYVTGNPHYDRYRGGASCTRDIFLKKWNLSPDKKFILYAPVSDALIRTNDMDENILNALSGLDASIVVRFPPEKPVTLKSFKPPSHMAYDRPGVVFKENSAGDKEMRPEDDQNLMDALIHADVVITGPTSILLDAAFFNKPVVAVNFYPTPRGFFEQVWRYTDNHIQEFLATGAAEYARSKEAMIQHIDTYLKNPLKDAEKRALARSMWLSHADGSAGERLAETILDLLR